jgi:hypothetical protein
VLVAVHGAALAFIPFLPATAGVVEIVPFAHPDPEFFARLARHAPSSKLGDVFLGWSESGA